MTDSSSGPASETRIRRVVWFSTTRTGKAALTLAYLTVLLPVWVLLVGQAVLLSAALMYFLGWLTTAQGGAAP